MDNKLLIYLVTKTQNVHYFTKAQKVQLGDVVVLKRPYHKEWQIIVVGHVIGAYSCQHEWLLYQSA